MDHHGHFSLKWEDKQQRLPVRVELRVPDAPLAVLGRVSLKLQCRNGT